MIWFVLHTSNLSWMPYCIFPSWIDRYILFYSYIKTFNWFWSTKITGSLWSGLQYWTTDWTGKLIAVESLTQFLVDVQSQFLVDNYFLNQALQPTSTGGWCQVCIDDHRPLFCETCETNWETRFSLKFVNVGDKPNFLKLVFVLFL